MTTTALVPSQKSTIVRSFLNLHPGLAAWLSEQLFCRTPRRHRPSAAAREVLASAQATTLGLGDRTVTLYAWGDDGPTVMLAHGWGGASSQMTALVAPLRARGFRVVAFDQPGHGTSPGHATDIGEMSRTIRRVAALTGPIHGIVAHSLGAAAAALAIHDGLAVERIVLLSPAAEPGSYWSAFTGWLGLTGASRQRASARVRARLGMPLRDADIVHTLRDADADILVVHDELDRSTPVAASRRAVERLPHARGLWTRGLGHARGLTDPAVVAAAVDLVAVGRWPDSTRMAPCATPTCPHTAEPDGRGLCLSCAVEHDLRSHYGDHAA